MIVWFSTSRIFLRPNRRKKGDLKSISFPLRLSDCLLFTELAQEIMDEGPLDVWPLPYYLDWRWKLEFKIPDQREVALTCSVKSMLRELPPVLVQSCLWEEITALVPATPLRSIPFNNPSLFVRCRPCLSGATSYNLYRTSKTTDEKYQERGWEQVHLIFITWG